MSTTESAPDQPMSMLVAFRAGFMATWTSVFTYVLLGKWSETIDSNISSANSAVNPQTFSG